MYAVIIDGHWGEDIMSLTLEDVLCLVSKRSKAEMLATRLPHGLMMTMREAQKEFRELNNKAVIRRLLIT